MSGNGFPLHIHFHVTFSSAGGMVAISMAARVPVRCSMHCRREARRARYVLCCAVVYTYVSSNNWRKYRKSSSITLHRSSTSITSPRPSPSLPPPISSKQASKPSATITYIRKPHAPFLCVGEGTGELISTVAGMLVGGISIS